MSIASANTAARHPALNERAPGARTAAAFQLGETAELTILERVDNRLYRAVLGNSSRIVESTIELTPGTRLIVQITATGERLVLRSADPRVAGVSLQEALPGARMGDLLSKLARRHRVSLDQEQTGLVERAMQQADEPQAMAAAGLFLGKLGLPLEGVALQALYEAQVWPSAAPAQAAGSHLQTLTNAAQLSTAILQHFTADERSEPPPAQLPAAVPVMDVAPGQDDAAGRDARQPLAQQLLNTSNEGGLGYQYGVLPLLIADQLVELDVLCFQSAATALPAGLRRLTMAFDSQTLGRIEVNAQALGESLVLNIRAAAAAPSEVLAAHAEELRELVARLGWRVESLAYEHTQVPRAATQLLQHVLNADTLDRLL